MSPSIDWSRIERFIGYGRIDAPIVFVGMEEGLASEQDLDHDLEARSAFSPVMDLEEAHRTIAEGDNLFTDSPRRQPTWRVMADLMLQYEKQRFPDAQSRALARKIYRAKRLGRSSGKTLLTELLPYPHRRTSSWLYSRFGRYTTREEYVSKLLPERQALIRHALFAFQRAAIICYGRSDWLNFKAMFPEVQWVPVLRFECAAWRGARIILCDHFATKYFNTDTQLNEFAAVVLPEC